jgi:hypothetical protein
MIFECIWKKGKKIEKWPGRIENLQEYGSHYEMLIQSRSSIRVTFGKTSSGAFACMPDFNAGCHLVNLHDTFWNTESLTRVLGKVDGITVATALYHLADKIAL